MKPPERIYLQYYGDGDPEGPVCELEVTHTLKGPVHKNDIEYVRADLYQELEKKLKARQDWMFQGLADTIP